MQFYFYLFICYFYSSVVMNIGFDSWSLVIIGLGLKIPVMLSAIGSTVGENTSEILGEFLSFNKCIWSLIVSGCVLDEQEAFLNFLFPKQITLFLNKSSTILIWADIFNFNLLAQKCPPNSGCVLGGSEASLTGLKWNAQPPIQRVALQHQRERPSC